MYLADIVKELERQVKDLSNFGYGIRENIKFKLTGRIIFESKKGSEVKYIPTDSGETKGKQEKIEIDGVYFEGSLIYLTDSGSGELRFSPINLETRKNFIVDIAKETAKKECYEFSYDKKRDNIHISSGENLEKELKRAKEIFGSPIKTEFEI